MASLAGLAANAAPVRTVGTSPRVNLAQIEQARAGGDNNDTSTASNAGTGYAAPTPAAAAPAKLGDYASQYEQSLAASRADIEHQIGSALADINAKEGRSQQAVGLLPGELKGIYAAGNAGLDQNAAALDSAQKASGLTSFMGAGAQLAPLRSAVAADSAARQADIPLLNIGLAQQAASEHAALQQQRLASYADLDNQQRQFLATQAQQAAGYAHDNASQQTGADLQLRNTLAAYGAEHPATANSYGLLTSPAAGASLAQTDPAHAASLRGSPAYVKVVQTLQGLGGAKVAAMLADPAWLSGFQSGNPQYGGTGATLSPQAMSLALYDAGYKP